MHSLMFLKLGKHGWALVCTPCYVQKSVPLDKCLVSLGLRFLVCKVETVLSGLEVVLHEFIVSLPILPTEHWWPLWWASVSTMLSGEWSWRIEIVSLPRARGPVWCHALYKRTGIWNLGFLSSTQAHSRHKCRLARFMPLRRRSIVNQRKGWHSVIYSSCAQLKSFASEPGVLCLLAMIQEIVAKADIHQFFSFKS
jgi:hypothetical protein